MDNKKNEDAKIKNFRPQGRGISFPAREEEILNFWEKNKIFEKSVNNPPNPPSISSGQALYQGGIKDYVFYDGPPFATGTPHYGHIVASLMKDIVPRYWTMKGYRVERRWGWDCHGLPIENIVEKEMKTKSKKDIEKIGVEKFNEQCRSKVLAYAKEWEKTVRRLGRWVDMENAYKTMDLDYMESVWWVFKQLWDKGLIYKDYRSMHICPRCETTLSQSEVAEGYKMVKDLSVVVKFELENITNLQINHKFTNDDKVYFLAWTTTPWTLIGNVALAVGEKIEYVLIKIKNQKSPPKADPPLAEKIKITNENEKFILAKDGLDKLLGEDGYEILKEFKSKDLIGKKYKPLFDYYAGDEKLENRENGWKVYAANFVNTEEGTGIVHIAPAFGEDDMNLGREKKLPFIQHVNMNGTIKEEARDFAGRYVKPADDVMKTDVEIMKYLADKGLLFSKEKYEHSYPHCWRCETPLLNYATSSWFVNITKIKTKMLKLAKKINWVPAHIKEGRFGNWLEGARDWSISRQRYWASAIPIWTCDGHKNTKTQKHKNKCDGIKVIGSVKELEELSGEKVTNLHKHVVDEITFACKKCKGEMKRIPDVLDCWFESGSMPYAQMHYPFENKKKFEANFPAEFIAEGVDQTRTWFYYLHAIAIGIKGSHAFKNVVVNGIVLAEDGKKMSKRLNNYPDPMEIMNKYGADPLRYYLCASPVMKADNINFSEKDLAEQTRFFNILLNVLSFYKMFAPTPDPVRLSAHDEASPAPCVPSASLGTGAGEGSKVKNLEKKDLLNVLDKWITARLEQTKQIITEKMDNYDLHAVREIPVFINDLSTWYVRRSRDRFKGDDEIDKMRALKTLRRTLYHLARIMAPFLPFTAEHIYQELGADVESIHLKEWPEVRKEWIDKGVLGKMEVVRKIVELGLAKRDEAGIKVRQALQKFSIFNFQFSINDEYLNLIKEELNVREIEVNKGQGELKVELDTTMTDDLKREGIKRELVRAINNLRKETGMTIGDRAVIYFKTENKEIKEVFEKFGEEIKKDTLADEIRVGGDGKMVKINEQEISLKVEKK